MDFTGVLIPWVCMPHRLWIIVIVLSDIVAQLKKLICQIPALDPGWAALIAGIPALIAGGLVLRARTPLIYGHVYPHGIFRLDMNARIPTDTWKATQGVAA
jgi:hypothetical protein